MFLPYLDAHSSIRKIVQLPQLGYRMHTDRSTSLPYPLYRIDIDHMLEYIPVVEVVGRLELSTVAVGWVVTHTMSYQCFQGWFHIHHKTLSQVDFDFHNLDSRS